MGPTMESRLNLTMKKKNTIIIAMIVTLLLHCGLFHLATAHFPRHHSRLPADAIVKVSIPITTSSPIPKKTAPNLSALILPPGKLLSSDEVEQPLEKDHYYQQQELSVQTHILIDNAKDLDIPISQSVILSLYINEEGHVDDVIIDNPGALSEDEKKQIIDGFKTDIFIPGMLGKKIVKSLYRIELAVNAPTRLPY